MQLLTLYQFISAEVHFLMKSIRFIPYVFRKRYIHEYGCCLYCFGRQNWFTIFFITFCHYEKYIKVGRFVSLVIFIRSLNRFPILHVL